MEKINFNARTFIKAFDINMHDVLPKADGEILPFGVSQGIIFPGEISKSHCHDELETFIFIEGKGIVECNGNCINVNSGDIVHFDPFEVHSIKNIGTTNLSFITVYWHDHYIAANYSNQNYSNKNINERVYVTSTPPTPNGDLHLGHLSGPYLGADVHTRYLKMRGIDAYHISGSDDFQSYVVAKANHLGSTPEDIANYFSDEIKSTLDALNIHLDKFTRPLHNHDYQLELANFVYNLWEQGILIIEEESALFDIVSGDYIYEANVKGKCHYCHSTSCGNICEECGHSNACVEMKDTISTLSHTKPEVKSLKRLHFPLTKYLDEITKHYQHASMSAHLRILYNQMKERGFDNIAVSHPGKWGVSVPITDLQDQTVWVWFEMLFGYLFTIRELERDAGKCTTSLAIPENARIVHFFGFDNSFYHSILFPAVYTAAFPVSPLSIDYVCNEFYLLDGLKFSTSRGHAVWGKEILKEFSADQVRFYLGFSRPETSRTNFSMSDFKNVINLELIGNWHTWLMDLDNRIQNDFHGKAPDTGVWTLEQRNFFGKLQQFITDVAAGYEVATFSLQRVTRLLCELVREAQFFSSGNRLWCTVPSCHAEYRTAIALEIAAARLLALLAAPLMPEFSRLLWHSMSNAEDTSELAWPSIPPFATPGTEIKIQMNNS
jgi:methionyl-tRNA synthetase